MNVCFVTSECAPFVKTGGLADVSGSLPKALSALGCSVKLFLPDYDVLKEADDFAWVEALRSLPVNIGDHTVSFSVRRGILQDSGVEVDLIHCPRYFHRDAPYTNDGDEHERFILFQHAVLRVLQQEQWAPDVVHCNDWQTALLPVYLKRNYGWDRLFEKTASLYTIHNLSYQGKFDRSHLYAAALDVHDYYPGGPFEFYDSFCFMKTGIVFADAVSTVSPTYAREIQQPGRGEGLDGVLRTRSEDLFGILNGIDTDVWSPASDPLIPQQYDSSSLDGKRVNRNAMLKMLRLPEDGAAPVVGIISRMAHQKGLDLLQPVMDRIITRLPVRFAVLGSGERYLEDFFNQARADYPDRIGVYIGYNEELAHLIEAGSDMFLIPSRYEPCGLNQMYSLAYGTVPVVRATGGLADTVQDVQNGRGGGNGFAFLDCTPDALYDALARAVEVHADRDRWRMIQKEGMRGDYSWSASARKYVDLYEQLAGSGLSGK